MVTRLEIIKAQRDDTHRAPIYLKREDGTWDWDDCVAVRQVDFDRMMAALELAVVVMREDDHCRELQRKEDAAEDYMSRVVLRKVLGEQAYKLASYRNDLRTALTPLIKDVEV